mmetsp:Transcript_11793/g.24948  ORF Transcript_11793/g.24948 Transcript_11793/m.24948 type:complete len:749 (-) Transcript_11793:183-2429(-)
MLILSSILPGSLVSLIAIAAFVFGGTAIVDAQLLSKWTLSNPATTNFVDATNTFTMTYDVDNSIIGTNTVGEFYQNGCKEENKALGSTTGIKDVVTNVYTPGTATLSFYFDVDALSQNNEVVIYDGEEAAATMEICVRFMLMTEDQNTEVNFIESIIKMTFDLTAGFRLEAFNVSPKLLDVSKGDKSYGADAFLCNPDTGEIYESNIFTQGKIISVCVKPNQEAIDDGLFLKSIDSFSWTREAVNQLAIVAGSQADDGLTLYTCGSGSEFCTLSTLLYADFYKTTKPPSSAPSSAPTRTPTWTPAESMYPAPTSAPNQPYDPDFCEDCITTCTLDFPEISTQHFVHGFCTYDTDFVEILGPGGNNTYTVASGDFQRSVQLFGDQSYTANITYDGTGTTKDQKLCEGGTYHQPDLYQSLFQGNAFQFIASESNDYSSSTSMRVCAMVSDQLDEDGGLNDWLAREKMSPDVTWPVVLNNPFILAGEANWAAIGGEKGVENTYLGNLFSSHQEIRVQTSQGNRPSYGIYLPSGRQSSIPDGSVFELVVGTGTSGAVVLRFPTTIEGSTTQKTEPVAVGESMVLVMAYGVWFVEGENEEFNGTGSHFNIIDSSSSVVGKMNVYCFDFEPSECTYHDYNRARRERRGLQIGADANQPVVEGEGTSTLSFGRRSRRDLRSSSSRANDGRVLQGADDGISSEIGLEVTLSTDNDERGAVKTASSPDLPLGRTTSITLVLLVLIASFDGLGMVCLF